MERMSNEAIEALITQLDAVDESPGAAALRARSYELLRAVQGTLVVDVGCGAGRAVAELADQRVRVIGIDVNDQMIALARQRWPSGEFRVGDAYALPLGNGEAAGYRADKVIHALADLGRALAEARRVLTSGGRIRTVRAGLGHLRDRLQRPGAHPHHRAEARGAGAVAAGRPSVPQSAARRRLPRRDGGGAHRGVYRRFVFASAHPPRRGLLRARRDRTCAGRRVDRRT